MTRLSLLLVLTVACGGTQARPEPEATIDPQPEIRYECEAGTTEDACMVCTVGAAPTACCAHRVEVPEECGDRAAPLDHILVASDPCRLNCRAGEVAVDLAPNADESRLGCVSCPAP